MKQFRKMNKKEKSNSIFVRSFTFGVEDSLVSTVGMLSGMASTGVTPKIVFISGAILIIVEALSMAMGSFLSEQSSEEYETHRETKDKKPILAALVMFVSYLAAGLIPLTPYLIFQKANAFSYSIGLSLLALFLLGFISGKLFKIHMFRKGIQMLILGALAIVVGIMAGKILETYLL